LDIGQGGGLKTAFSSHTQKCVAQYSENKLNSCVKESKILSPGLAPQGAAGFGPDCPPDLPPAFTRIDAVKCVGVARIISH
jgi:hypothetical protein